MAKRLGSAESAGKLPVSSKGGRKISPRRASRVSSKGGQKRVEEGGSPAPTLTRGSAKGITSKRKSSSEPDPTQWYRLVGEVPFPVQIFAHMKNKKGKLLGIGVLLRIPVPWEEYLQPCPTGRSPEQE